MIQRTRLESLPRRTPPQENVCEMSHWRLECLPDVPGDRWVCELVCESGFRHAIYLAASMRRCLKHARRWERHMIGLGLLPAPLPFLNTQSGVMTWPDCSAVTLSPMKQAYPAPKGPRAHLTLVD